MNSTERTTDARDKAYTMRPKGSTTAVGAVIATRPARAPFGDIEVSGF